MHGNDEGAFVGAGGDLISEGLIVQVAERLRMLGQPTRLRLVELLTRGPSTPQELANVLGLSQQNVSKHLQQLHRGGVLHRSPEGVRVVYELVDSNAVDLLGLAMSGVTRHLERLARLASGQRDDHEDQR